MLEHTSPHDGLLSAANQTRTHKGQKLKVHRQLDRMSRFELVEHCEEHGLRHAGRSDEDLRTLLVSVLEQGGNLPASDRINDR